jgi:uncharacterized protein (DUF4415 family)
MRQRELFQCERQKKMKQTSTIKKSETDWDRLNAMEDKDIDFSDIPRLTPEQFAKGVLMKGLKPVDRKILLSLRVDQDVLEWFKAQGAGYQTKMNQLLRAYMEAHE